LIGKLNSNPSGPPVEDRTRPSPQPIPTFTDPQGLQLYIGQPLIPHMTTDGPVMGKSKREVPIYERLAEGECLVILRDDDGVLVACNKKGDIALKRLPYPKRKGTGA